MGEVVGFTGITKVDCTPEEVLEKAKDWGMVSCCIVGFDKDNNFHFGGSISDIAQIVLMLEIGKAQMVKLAGED